SRDGACPQAWPARVAVLARWHAHVSGTPGVLARAPLVPWWARPAWAGCPAAERQSAVAGVGHRRPACTGTRSNRSSPDGIPRWRHRRRHDDGETGIPAGDCGAVVAAAAAVVAAAAAGGRSPLHTGHTGSGHPVWRGPCSRQLRTARTRVDALRL